MSSLLSGLGSAAASAGNSIGNALTSAGSAALDGLSSAGSAIESGAQAVGSGIADAGAWVGNQAASFGDWLTKPTTTASSAGGNYLPASAANASNPYKPYIEMAQKLAKNELEREREKKMQAAMALVQMGNNQIYGRKGY